MYSTCVLTILCLDLSILAGRPKNDGLSDSGRVDTRPVNSYYTHYNISDSSTTLICVQYMYTVYYYISDYITTLIQVPQYNYTHYISDNTTLIHVCVQYRTYQYMYEYRVLY